MEGSGVDRDDLVAYATGVKYSELADTGGHKTRAALRQLGALPCQTKTTLVRPVVRERDGLPTTI